MLRRRRPTGHGQAAGFSTPELAGWSYVIKILHTSRSFGIYCRWARCAASCRPIVSIDRLIGKRHQKRSSHVLTPTTNAMVRFRRCRSAMVETHGNFTLVVSPDGQSGKLIMYSNHGEEGAHRNLGALKGWRSVVTLVTLAVVGRAQTVQPKLTDQTPRASSPSFSIKPYHYIDGKQRLQWFLGSTVGPETLTVGLFSAGFGTARDKP